MTNMFTFWETEPAKQGGMCSLEEGLMGKSLNTLTYVGGTYNRKKILRMWGQKYA